MFSVLHFGNLDLRLHEELHPLHLQVPHELHALLLQFHHLLLFLLLDPVIDLPKLHNRLRQFPHGALRG